MRGVAFILTFSCSRDRCCLKGRGHRGVHLATRAGCLQVGIAAAGSRIGDLKVYNLVVGGVVASMGEFDGLSTKNAEFGKKTKSIKELQQKLLKS